MLPEKMTHTLNLGLLNLNTTEVSRVNGKMQTCSASMYSLSFIAGGTIMVVIPCKTLNEIQRSFVHLPHLTCKKFVS